MHHKARLGLLICATSPPQRTAEQSLLCCACAGHYLLVVGYDSETDRFMVQDPASTAELNSVPTYSLEAARLAYGTDEDLLLISLPPSAPAFSTALVAF